MNLIKPYWDGTENMRRARIKTYLMKKWETKFITIQTNTVPLKNELRSIKIETSLSESKVFKVRPLQRWPTTFTAQTKTTSYGSFPTFQKLLCTEGERERKLINDDLPQLLEACVVYQIKYRNARARSSLTGCHSMLNRISIQNLVGFFARLFEAWVQNITKSICPFFISSWKLSNFSLQA